LTPFVFQIDKITTRLYSFRSGAPLISKEELAQIDTDWIKWRAEWVRRRKIFNECVPTLDIDPVPLCSWDAFHYLWLGYADRSWSRSTLLAHFPFFGQSPVFISQPMTANDNEFAVPISNYLNRFWTMATDVLPPQDATSLAEDLGIEVDTDEHMAVERGPLCTSPELKRKRM
jgi:26S proteasome regulatory subunit (ATPase 3-interacting protein)